MHTVFLVEDEPLIRQNIRNVIERVPDLYTCVGEAGDGELALAIIQDVKPDILITDIKMPFMDGLTLTRYAKALIPWLRTIIISGYDDFQLAQQAISVGVDYYLLKPVVAKELLTALGKASDLIFEHRRHSASFLQETSDGERIKIALVNDLLQQLCCGEIAAEEALNRANELKIDLLGAQYVVLIALFEGKDGFPNRQIITSKVKYALSNEPDVLFFLSSVDHLVLIIKAKADIDLTEKAYHIAQTLKHEVEDDGAVLLTFSISSLTNHISEIRNAFHEASVLLKTFGSAKRGRIFCSGDISRIQQPIAASVDNYFNLNIENKLKFAVAEDVPAIVAEFIENYSTDDVQQIFHRYYILMDLMNSGLKIIRNFKPDLDSAEIVNHFLGFAEIFQSTLSAVEFSDFASQICLKTIELRDHGNSSHHVKLVRRACEYIRDNYNNPDISLNQVASQVALSPTHFSTIFAQEMSETFIEHLTKVRIEKVKELLATTDEKIINIAFDVGYNEPNYLSYLFKKREGISPKEYRKISSSPP